MRAPRGAAAILILQRGQQVGYAINVVIGNEALPVGTAALQVALHVLQRGDPREGEQCGEAAAVAHEDVGVQPVAHHDGARGVDVELAHHAVEHVAVGLAHDEGLALRRRLHGLHQAAGACGERGEAQPAAAAAGSAAAGTRSWVLGTQAGEGRCYSAKVVFCKEHNCLRVLSLDSGHIKEVIVAGEHVFENPNGSADGDVAEEPGNPDDQEQDLSTELIKVKLLVNKDGRYVCELCQKTFKTASILKAHMITHSSRKDYECKLCGTSFRTKGSLIRHHRRHTDERPYKCKKCGKSFRESGALTRHLKSLTPCTEKIRFNVNKEIVVNKDDLPAGSCSSNTDTVSSIASESMESPPVIHLVTDAKGNVLHEVHVQMQELPVVDAKTLDQDVSQPCEGEVHSENLLRQYCSRGFREKGSLVRHIRHHTGEKPFKCYKCGRGFAEHGTLNRHLKTKGGCLLALKEVKEVMVPEESQSADNLAATVISEDPHTVLVEFSSVVADTQEYIIETATEDMETSEAAEIIEGTRHEVDSHIMKVVQQIVNQANSGHQIIVQNVTVAENSEGSADAADTITIATPESLTEQVAMTLASAIGEGAVLTTEGGIEAQEATVTMVASEDIEIMEHAGEFVIASQEGEVEVQTVIV
uniref:E4F transcription factor 1 n=1 Tax=Nothoprocta perdicaria TaxID=30464 RepID=A0A8C7EG09_NOTPE